MISKKIIGIVLISFIWIGCTTAPVGTGSTTTPHAATNTPAADTATPQPSATPERQGYHFPTHIDPALKYLFYLHGRIIEDQGIPAISPEFGEYQYEEILETLSGYGFIVISEQRPKDTDGVSYANKIRNQVTKLLNADVPANHITVIGASKGAGITIYVSHLLENKEVNFVIMGICHPQEVERLMQSQVNLYGNVLSIYDYKDDYAGSCQELFTFSEGKGISRYDEIVLNIGTGHGILYQPLDEWVIPAVQWADSTAP
jgi:hypothetical protein